jgi:hypothetical protein
MLKDGVHLESREVYQTLLKDLFSAHAEVVPTARGLWMGREGCRFQALMGNEHQVIGLDVRAFEREHAYHLSGQRTLSLLAVVIVLNSQLGTMLFVQV